jgi:hypothetical protein
MRRNKLSGSATISAPINANMAKNTNKLASSTPAK